jgi:hypothetical protein
MEICNLLNGVVTSIIEYINIHVGYHRRTVHHVFNVYVQCCTKL